MQRLIDLHTHSTASDGTMSPRDLVAYAKKKRAAAIALTDHDTIEGLAAAARAGIEYHLEVIPGIEISARFPGGNMHILGYLFDPQDKQFSQELKKLQEARRQRNPKIIEKLQALGIPITLDQVKTFASGQMGRPHIAQALMQLGAVSSFDEAFQKYLTTGAPAYVEKFGLSPEKAISLINRAGGISVLAHPFTLNCSSLRELKDLLQELKDQGLRGLECFFAQHTPEQTRDYLTLAKGMDFLVTGGTDFHGANNEGVDLLSGHGNLKIPYQIAEDLKKGIKGPRV